MADIINFLVRSTALLLYYVSYLIPRNKRLWVFGEANGFNNNSKYLYLEVIKSYPDIRALWIGPKDIVEELRQQGLPAENRKSIKGIFYCLFAKCYFVSSTPGDINFYTSGGAIVINLWHGVGWKACLWNNPIHKKYEKANLIKKIVHLVMNPHLYYKPNYVLSTSPTMTECFFVPMFKVKKDQCIEDIYPRCKFMLQEETLIINHIKQYENHNHLQLIQKMRSYNRIIIYAPTFRDTGSDFLVDSGIDFNDLNTFFIERNYLFIIKCHPATSFSKARIDGYSNILHLDNRFDLYLLMPFSDILISDYSSIALDYLLLQKKVIFYPFDLEQYNNSCRDFVIDYMDSIKEAIVVTDYKSLKLAIEQDNFPINPALINRFWCGRESLIEVIKEYVL